MNNFNKLRNSIQLYIASKVLNQPKENLIFGFEVNEQMEKVATEYLTGKPLSKIFKEKYFWSQCFYTNEHTLDPRPSTEKIIESLVNNYNKEIKFSFLDLGTGTGAICATILSLFPNSVGTAIEISDEAIKVAQYNLKNLGLIDRCKIIKNNWLENIDISFDILVSNPPYLSLKEYNDNISVLQYDPLEALVPDEPLIMYKKIADKQHLFNEIYLEIPPKRKKQIKNLFNKVHLCY